MPPAPDPKPPSRVLWSVVHGAFILGVRPVARRLSFRTLDRLGLVLAVPIGVLFAVLGRRMRLAYLRQLGLPTSWGSLLRHSIREARARLRENISYLHPDVPVKVRPGAAAWAAREGASVVAAWSAYGTLLSGLWTASTRCRFVRFPFNGEGEARPEEVRIAQRWLAEKAAVRHDAFGKTQIVPGTSVTAYLRALRAGSPLLILQDVIDESGQSPPQELLGLSLPVPTGAARLARAADVPLYVLTGGVEDGVPWVDAEGPIPADERVVLDRMEACIRAEPWAWGHWDLAMRLGVPATTPADEPAPAVAPRRVGVRRAVAG